MRRPSALPYVLAALAPVLTVAVVVLNELAGSHGAPVWESALGGFALLCSAGVGLLVVVRRQGHPIGWLLLANALIIGAAGIAEAYANYAVLEDPGALPGGEWAVAWNEDAWPLLFVPLTALAFVFPDGRLPSPRWRPVAYGVAATFVGMLILSFFGPEPFPAPFDRVEQPLPQLPPAAEFLYPLLMLAAAASFVAAVNAVRVRFRRASGVERLQLKWLALSSVLVPVTFLVCLAASLAAEGVEQSDPFTALVLVMLGTLPASVGVAVLRYRLYEIDRIINRTLVYGVLTVALAVAYSATTLLLGTALGSGSPWATAGATLAAAACFRPLRGWIQDAVDRRFARARYDALRQVGDFLEALRAGRAAPEDIEPLLRDVLSDPSLELRFFLPASELYVDARGRPAEDSPDDPRERTPVERAGQPLGIVLHAPAGEERPGLLAMVVEAAGLALEIARLRVELRRQLDEVEASRARIVSAGDEERRRLERDLHDGAQQRLVSIGLQLRHVQHELGDAPNGAVKALDRPVEEIRLAIQELRDLAQGVRPAALDDGLAPALRQLAPRTALPVEIEVGGERFPEDLEATAYFVASEGLTNAIKHAEASKALVRVGRRGEELVVSVSDDGVGGASEGAGSGLRGLADRVCAQGGTIELESEPREGTTLTARLPCAS